MSDSTEATKLAEVLGADSQTVSVATASNRALDIVVRPLRLKQFSEVLKCIDELSEAGVTIFDDGKGFDTAKLLLRGGDSVMKLLAVATGQPLELIENLDLADAANLAGAVWQVNANFFKKKADSMLAAFGVDPATAQKVKALLGSLTQSLSSSAAAPSPSSAPAI